MYNYLSNNTVNFLDIVTYHLLWHFCNSPTVSQYTIIPVFNHFLLMASCAEHCEMKYPSPISPSGTLIRLSNWSRIGPIRKRQSSFVLPTKRLGSRKYQPHFNWFTFRLISFMWMEWITKSTWNGIAVLRFSAFIKVSQMLSWDPNCDTVPRGKCSVAGRGSFSYLFYCLVNRWNRDCYCQRQKNAQDAVCTLPCSGVRWAKLLSCRLREFHTSTSVERDQSHDTYCSGSSLFDLSIRLDKRRSQPTAAGLTIHST